MFTLIIAALTIAALAPAFGPLASVLFARFFLYTAPARRSDVLVIEALDASGTIVHRLEVLPENLLPVIAG